MAEQVQAALDDMVAPLADLMDRNIFTQMEIHAIVSRRRESEYLLRRRTPRKADFLRYIQDELLVEKLRELRTKKLQAEERERLAKLGRLEDLDNISTSHIGDPHILQHIHLLFRRTLRKYNSDVSIYLQYADVCKELHSWNKLPQVYAEAVQIHPHCSGLWIEAASHEFFHRQSVISARILLQRALRINKIAKDLWWQSFALEFHYIAKMKGRRAVLQIEEETPTDDNNPLDSSLYAVAKIVYDNAIEAIPNDVSFRLRFLNLCKTFPHTDSMEAYIFKTIRRDFQDNSQAWIARAAQLLEQRNHDDTTESKGFAIAPAESTDEEEDSDEENNSDGKRPNKKRRTNNEATDSQDPVLAMIRKATRAVQTSDMYLESIRFLWVYWEKAEEEDPETETTQEGILKLILELLTEALSNRNVYNNALALEHAEYYARIDQPEQGRQVLSDYIQKVLEKMDSNDNLTTVWLQLAELTFEEQSAATARDVLKKALKHTSMSQQNGGYGKILLHLLGVELVMAKNGKKKGKTTKIVKDTFQKILLLESSGSQDDNTEDTKTSFGLSSVAQACFHVLMQMIDSLEPVSGVRETCKMILLESKFLERQNANSVKDIEPLVAFFDKCLEVGIENIKKHGAQKSKKERRRDRAFIRQLFEAAIRLFKDVPSLVNKYQQEQHEALLL